MSPTGRIRAGTVLFVPGRGDSLELRAPLAQALVERGWGVVMVEHHGQGGSGRLGHHPDAVHVENFDLHLETQRAAIRGMEGPIALVGHSMGGLVGLELLATEPGRVSRAVFTSPLWSFAGPLPTSLVRVFTGVARALHQGRSFAAGEGPFSLRSCLAMRLGTDGLEGELVEFVGAHPELVRGGSTWGWVDAAAAMMQRVVRRRLEEVQAEVLVVTCARDKTVSRAAQDALTLRFAKARQLVLDCGHDPFFAPDKVRARLWTGLGLSLAGAA
jgi:lysophospholipase